MNYRNIAIFILSLWLAILTACQPGTSGDDGVTATAVEDLGAEAAGIGTGETVMATSEDGLIINENVRRSSMFNINTLAYGLPDMNEVGVINVTYAYYDGEPLTMDVYTPPGTEEAEQLPTVVFGLGYRMSSEALRNEHFYTSWGKLVAAAGMAAVIYDTEQPDKDLEILMNFIRQNAADLQINPNQLGIMASSANVPTVMSYLMQAGRDGIRFAVYYYGLSLTPDHKYADELSGNCVDRGCLYSDLADVSYVDPEVPLFIVKAGQDFIPNINEAMDHFIEYVRAAGATVTDVNYEEGTHGFDTKKGLGYEEGTQIIADTVAFMRAGFGLESP